MSAVYIPEIQIPRSVLFPRMDDWKRFIEILQMAGSKTNYLSKKAVEEASGGVAFTAPTNVYVGLWTAALGDTSTGAATNEATYGSYARTQIGTGNNQTDAWNASTGTTTATVTNKNSITFPTSSGTSNTITYIGIVDSVTVGAGNMLYWTDVTSVTINNGDTPKINASAISIVED